MNEFQEMSLIFTGKFANRSERTMEYLEITTAEQALEAVKRDGYAFFQLIAFITLIFMGCASNTVRSEQSLDNVQCDAGEFRGYGIGSSREEAQSAAYSDLAKQISSSIKIIESYDKSQSVYNGVENLSSEYASKTVLKANLSNINDARILQFKQTAREKIEVVACMSRTDATKGFLKQQQLILDSMEMASNFVLGIEHPKQKNEAWQKVQMLWNEFTGIQNLLEGWGVDTKHSEQANAYYSKAKGNYKTYCQNTKVHWEDTENECSSISFAKLSKGTKMEKSKCSYGLKLRFSCAEKCKSFSLGAECTFEPSLAIESCEGERYSLLRAKEPVTGYHEGNKNMAMENLIENFGKTVFFKEWEKEVRKWVPQCVD
jgi:hypothetical protein